MEADDDRIGGPRQQDVVARDAADAGEHDAQGDLAALDALEGLLDGFQRALHVGPQHHRQLADMHRFGRVQEIIQRQPPLGGLQ